MTTTTMRKSRLKDLISKGREQGYVTYAEVNDHLPQEISDPDQIQDIVHMINDLGIQVFEKAPDADELLLSSDDSPDDIAAAEAAASLAAVETEAGRTTDPVRMYMREMGTVDLLTREGEIVIAKRIEEGIRDVTAALVFYPGIVQQVLDRYSAIVEKEGQRSFTELLTGYLNPVDVVPPAAQQIAAVASDDKGPAGLDEEGVKARFKKLRTLHTRANNVIKKHGRYSKEAAKALEKLSAWFKFFKFTPRAFEPLVIRVRSKFHLLR